MRSDGWSVWAIMLVIMLAAQPVALAQTPPAPAASAHAQFPQLPLKRDSRADGSLLESLGWAALLIAMFAAAGLLVVRRKTWTSTGGGRRWLSLTAKPGAPKALGSTPLTQQASLHVVEWNGEELLLGCTLQTVSLLARRRTGAGMNGGLGEAAKEMT